MCDLDHLGKRNRKRGKGMKGCRIRNYCFDKIQLAKWFSLSRVVRDAKEAYKLLNLDNSMDVRDMVRYLQAVKKIGSTPFQ